MARKDAAGVRLITRAGNDFSSRFPFIAMGVGKLPVRSYLIDGEAIVTNSDGLAVFDLIRGHGSKASAVLCAFDLLELDASICCSPHPPIGIRILAAISSSRDFAATNYF